jgi:hypothetical protein
MSDDHNWPDTRCLYPAEHDGASADTRSITGVDGHVRCNMRSHHGVATVHLSDAGGRQVIAVPSQVVTIPHSYLPARFGPSGQGKVVAGRIVAAADAGSVYATRRGMVAVLVTGGDGTGPALLADGGGDMVVIVDACEVIVR